jgi:Ca2+-binding EF-hand superfamily protein
LFRNKFKKKSFTCEKMADANQKSKILEEFKKLDKDRSGYLDHEEIKRCLKDLYESIDLKMSDADVDALITQVDKNKDGRISVEEFVNLL